jgi:hypothetical protein
MQAHHAKAREPLGARGADVVLAEHFEHGRARHARDHRERHGAQHDGRKDQVVQRRPEGIGIAGAQRVDQEEASFGLDEVLHRDAPGNQRPSELHREEQDQQQPHQKIGIE